MTDDDIRRSGDAGRFGDFVRAYRSVSKQMNEEEDDKEHRQQKFTTAIESIPAFGEGGSRTLPLWVADVLGDNIDLEHHAPIFITLMRRLPSAAADGRPATMFDDRLSPRDAIASLHCYVIAAIRGIERELKRSRKLDKRECSLEGIEETASHPHHLVIDKLPAECRFELEAHLRKFIATISPINQLVMKFAGLSYREQVERLECFGGMSFSEKAVTMRYRRLCNRVWPGLALILAKYGCDIPIDDDERIILTKVVRGFLLEFGLAID